MSDAELFNFRIRFELPDSKRIGIEEAEFVILEDGDISIHLKSATGEAIQGSRSLALWGTGFTDEQQAHEEGSRWLSKLARALSGIQIGADFGRMPSGFVFQPFLEQLSAEAGHPVHNDVHGLMTFPASEHVAFSRVNAVGVMTYSPARSNAALRFQDLEPLDENELLAYELFSVSQFVATEPNVRLVTLMMAIEAAAKREPRTDEEQELIDTLIHVTKDSEISEASKQRLVSALGNLRTESARQAGRRLMASLDDRQYDADGLNALQLYDRCYRMRNALVHPEGDGVDQAELRTLGAQLEVLVGDLLTGPELRDEVYSADLES